MVIKRIPTFKPPTTLKAVAMRPPKREERAADIKFYQSKRWRALRATVLREEPVCRMCERAPANHVDHIKKRKLHPELAFERSNLQGLCQPCHNAKEGR